MTGSPVFKYNANLTKKHKIQRKLNFVRDVPRNPLRLHIDNLLVESDRNSDSQDEKEAPKPVKSVSSLSSFVFKNKKGVKRKLDFEADNVSDEVSSFKFGNQNISLNGFHSRNSSLGDIKSVTISPSKNGYRRSSCTRSSIASTCRRRLFTDAEPETKKAKLESPILCPRPKRNEIKLSLKKRFPGVPNSDAARSGLLLNLAFSKYNMLNNGKEENVSVDFVDQKSARSSSKKELLQFSSIKKDSASFHYSPIFKAIKKVKRKLNLEEQDPANKITKTETLHDEIWDQVAVNPSSNTVDMDTGPTVLEISEKTDYQTCDNISVSKAIENRLEKTTEPVGLSSPVSVRTQMSATKCKGDLFKNSKLRPSLRNEIFNLSKPDLEDNGGSLSSFRVSNYQQTRKRSSFCSPRQTLAQRNSLGCVKSKPKYDRIIINKDFGEDKNSSRTDGGSTSYVGKNSESAASRSAKRWFDDSFYRGKCSDLRKSLFHRRQEAFLDSHIQRFLNDCAQAAELGVSDELPESQSTYEVKESEKIMPTCQMNTDPIGIIEDVESSVNQKLNKVDTCIEDISTTETQIEIATHRSETSPIVQFKTRISANKSSSKILKHCQEVTESVSELDKPAMLANDFIIEDINSQEISKHCVEEVEIFIENVESQECFPSFTKEGCHLPDDLSKKISHFPVFGVTAHDNVSNLVSVEKESANSCSQLPNSVDPNLQVEEISSSESVSDEPYFGRLVAENSMPNGDTLDSRNDVTFDSAKKRKRKKCYSDDLVGRLERLICREKSDMRMWEYEMSKKTKNQYDHTLEPAVFRVQKMWKEFSRLILLCTLAKQDTPDKLFESDEINNFGIDVTNSILLMMESSTCPKGLTYSSVFRIHPPWNILTLEKYDCVIILRPCRIEIISKDNGPPDSKDPTLPDLLRKSQFCSCAEACNCSLPEGYQTVMQPLLYSNSFLINFKSYRWKNYDEEYFKRTCSVNEVVLKNKLFPHEHLFLKLRVLHVHKNLICDGYVIWHMLCADEEEEVCCVVMEDEMKANFPVVERNEFLRFSGILLWKLIPAKTMSSFIDYIEFRGISGIKDRMGYTNLYVFAMSKNNGRIDRLT